MNNNLYNIHRAQAIGTLLGYDEGLLRFVFHHREYDLRLSAEELILEARELNEEEGLLVKIAVGLWCGDCKIKLQDIIDNLDDEKFRNVLHALAYFREIQCSEF